MNGFSAPSFSLGFDDDTQPQAPSFSLGLDLDLDYADLPTEGEEFDPEPAPTAIDLEDFNAEPCPGTLDPDLEDHPPVLKRFRRGPGYPPRPDPVSAGRVEEGRRAAPEFMNADDDIEEFSYQAERRNQDGSTSLSSHVACRSSKLSLHSHGLLTSQQAKNPKDLHIPPSKASTSENIDTSSNLKSFPELTISSIRNFCLVDSDSDDPSSDRDIHKDTKDNDASLKMRQFKSSPTASRNDGKEAFRLKNVQPDSFWKEIILKNNINLAIPVLDEFCEEYFRSVKDTKTNQHKVELNNFTRTRVLDPDDYQDDFQEYGQQKSIARKTAPSWNSLNPHPPAYQYFYHVDARIQALVRQRLCYFVPVGAENNINLAKPVLDEFPEEYFRSVKDIKTNQHKVELNNFTRTRVLDPDDYQDDFQEYGQQKCIIRKTAPRWNSPNPHPPAYQYFYHDDARIQALVRQRLCYFVPIGAVKHTGNQHLMTENLDYMAQFGTKNAPCQACGIPKFTAENPDYMSQFGTANTALEKGEGSSRKRGRKPKINKAKQASPSDEGWVNLKSNIGTPKVGGKRRVSADVNKYGHWFTRQNGRKVYVTKNGHEMTDRAAYTHYKKETGGGLKKSKKKTAAEKRTLIASSVCQVCGGFNKSKKKTAAEKPKKKTVAEKTAAEKRTLIASSACQACGGFNNKQACGGFNKSKKKTAAEKTKKKTAAEKRTLIASSVCQACGGFNKSKKKTAAEKTAVKKRILIASSVCQACGGFNKSKKKTAAEKRTLIATSVCQACGGFNKSEKKTAAGKRKR